MFELPFSLDPNLDSDALRRAFAASGHVSIEPFLSAESAALLRDHLAGREDWVLTMNPGPRVFNLERAALEAMSPEQRQALQKLAAPTGESDFRYMFEHIVVARNESGPQEDSSPVGQFARFMSSPSVLEMMRTITGAEDIAFADARATAYRGGHFLTMHCDGVEGENRRAAYVFGLTESWRSEWGGLLMFHDERGDVVRGLRPRMNALNLFAVPQQHSVSLVAPFAPVPRYSVTGWLRHLPG